MYFARRIFLILIANLIGHTVFAKEATIFDERRPLAMENDQVLPKDYFINAGSNDGLKPGVILTIYRHQTLYDVYQNKSPGDLIVAVGELKIIHAQGDISVARLESLHKHDDYPNVEFDAIMVGDKVDLGSARMASHKTAENDAPAAAATTLNTQVEVKLNSKDFSSVAPQAPVPTSAPM
jgi:hypothetical protein